MARKPTEAQVVEAVQLGIDVLSGYILLKRISLRYKALRGQE